MRNIHRDLVAPIPWCNAIQSSFTTEAALACYAICRPESPWFTSKLHFTLIIANFPLYIPVGTAPPRNETMCHSSLSYDHWIRKDGSIHTYKVSILIDANRWQAFRLKSIEYYSVLLRSATVLIAVALILRLASDTKVTRIQTAQLNVWGPFGWHRFPKPMHMRIEKEGIWES